MFTWPEWRTLYYVYGYELDKIKREIKALECKIKYPIGKDVIMKSTLAGDHFVWDRLYGKDEVLNQAGTICMQEIQKEYNKDYGYFISYKGTLDSSIKPYQTSL